MVFVSRVHSAGVAAIDKAVSLLHEVDRMLAAGSVNNARDAARASARRRAVNRLLDTEATELRKLA